MSGSLTTSSLTVPDPALAEPFLPAAPDEGACRWCDYQGVCGPYEEQRTARKYRPPLKALQAPAITTAVLLLVGLLRFNDVNGQSWDAIVVG